MAFRDHSRQLEYLRRASDLRDRGLTIDLRGYQYAVLLNWRDLRATEQYPWDRLCDALGGQGVPSLDEALNRLRFQAVHAALRRALCREHVEALQAASENARTREEIKVEARPEPAALASDDGQGPALAAVVVLPDATPVPEDENAVVEAPLDPVLAGLMERANEFYWRLTEVATPEILEQIAPDTQAGAEEYKRGLTMLVKAAVALPAVAQAFSAAWPLAVRSFVPGAAVGIPLERTWMPILAYTLFHALPGTAEAQTVFDSLDMRPALAETFAGLGMQGDDPWRYAARVRLLLGGRIALDELRTEGFWADGDVRWLARLNESEGVTYVNKESFEELLCWLQVPGLLGIAGRLGGDEAYESPAAELAEIEGTLRAECQRMADAGYSLKTYLGQGSEDEPEAVEDEAIVQ